MGGEPHAITVHQQSFLAATTWLRIGNLGTFRVRPAERRGPQDALKDPISHLADRLAAPHIVSCPFSLASKASQVGLPAWIVSAVFCCCLDSLREL